MTKLTKIIATIGPATETKEVLTEMMHAGMNVARFNTKHSDPVWHSERIARVKEAAAAAKLSIGVLLDLQGPEIRINTAGGGAFEVTTEDLITVVADGQPAEGKTFSVPLQVIEGLAKGAQILLEDGVVELTVVEKHSDHLIVQSGLPTTIKHRKTMDTPGLVLDMPSLTDRDYGYLDGVDLTLVDYVAISFVRNKEDIALLKKELATRHSQALIVAKIENQTALDNLDEIIEASDVVMIARGDLGVEVPFQELIFWQKQIIDSCRQLAIPVITATEMLKSMVERPRPTRAEVSDVAHAIYDGTDAIMLSDETTIGKYPVKCVQTQAVIAEFNEPYVMAGEYELIDGSVMASTCAAVVTLLESTEEPMSSVICLTTDGKVARLLASLHPSVAIHAIAPSERIAARLSVMYGVTGHVWPDFDQTNVQLAELTTFAQQQGIVKTGENAIMIYGKSDESLNLSIIKQ